jgi:4-hydroxy-tetrahydrodipicolinate synthase
LLVVTPYYIRPPQRGLVEYYADIGCRTQRPLLIYHIPGRAGVNTELATVKAIKERVPHLVGMKHAVNDIGFVTQMLDAFGPDWCVFVGLEELSFPMLAVGACGLMNAVGNLAPRKVADLYETVRKGDMEGARKLHFELFELNQSVFFDTNPIPIKYMMKRMGLIENNEHRLPMVPATAELEKRLDRVLAQAGLIEL